MRNALRNLSVKWTSPARPATLSNHLRVVTNFTAPALTLTALDLATVELPSFARPVAPHVVLAARALSGLVYALHAHQHSHRLAYPSDICTPTEN